MDRFSRNLLNVLVVLAFLGGAAYLLPGPATQLGLDVWNCPQSLLQLERERDRLRRLQDDKERITALTTAKRAMADEVIGGRLSLRAAATRMRDLDGKERESVQRYARELDAGISDDEHYCRRVILQVSMRLELDGQPDDVRRRIIRMLEKEMTDHLRQDSLCSSEKPPR